MPAVAVETSAIAQQTLPVAQSDFCRQPNEAAPEGHVVLLAMQVACSCWVKQQMCVERSHAVDPQRGRPAELNMIWLGTRAVEPPLLEPPLEPELLPDPPEDAPLELELPLDPDDEEPPELDPLASLSSSPLSEPLLLLLHAGVETETSAAMARGPRPRSHGYRRAAVRRAVM